MIFNSIDFAIFLPIVFLLYWYAASKNLRLQNFLIVAASYLFYGWWDWRFLSLILFSTVVDYSIGLLLQQDETERKRKLLLLTSIFVNLGFLGFFKYYNFFLDNFITAFSFFGTEIGSSSLNIVLPVGISFYTFQTMSYTIDVYRHKLEPTKDFIAFSAFVSFFPQLVAGPIERASHLLPQFYARRTFDYTKAVDGLRQILWGLFKKIVIADNAAQIANDIFNNSANFSGSTLFIGAVFFAFQIYGDFSGYSDIAIGTSRLFGFDLKQNFSFPYFSRDMGEFWRRWHISLSTWFRDYVYIPLGGSKGGTWMRVRNTFAIFIISGFWHGANWTFIVWGALNALYFLPLLLAKRNRVNMDVIAQNSSLPSIRETFQVLSTFLLSCLAWIFFRADSLLHAVEIISEIFSASLFEIPHSNLTAKFILECSIVTTFMLLIEWIGRHDKFALESFGFGWKSIYRKSFYSFIVLLIFLFIGKDQAFIYFQF